MALANVRLQYFNIEGLGEKARLAMKLARIPFVDDRVSFDRWPSMKPTTKYGQMPILFIDETKEIAQSDAILRFIGRSARLNGLPSLYPMDETDVDEAMGLVDDMMGSWRACLYVGMNPTALGHYGEDGVEFKGSKAHDDLCKKMREAWMRDEFPRYCGYFTKRFSSGAKFLCGDAPTLADCMLIPQLRRFASGGIDHVPASCLDAYPEVKAYYDRFHAIPEIKAWYDERAAA